MCLFSELVTVAWHRVLQLTDLFVSPAYKATDNSNRSRSHEYDMEHKR